MNQKDIYILIKQHYQNDDQSDLSIDDRKTMRQALLGILKMYINNAECIIKLERPVFFIFYFLFSW